MRTNLFLLTGLLGLCIAHAVNADENIVVVVPALLDPSAPIGDKVKQDCAVDTSVGSEVFLRVSERYPGTEQTRSPEQVAPGKIVVKITLVGVLGAGGGAWSGAKSITIRAEVLQNAKVIGTRNLSRQSSGGAFGGFSGTCAIMERIAVALGRDVAGWLPIALTMAKHESSSSDQTASQPPKEERTSPAAPDNTPRDPKQ